MNGPSGLWPPSSVSSLTRCGGAGSQATLAATGDQRYRSSRADRLGRTRVGRPLIIAVYHVTGITWKIIGARDLTDKELIEFSAWEETS
jgi:hypothetical protein